MDNLTKAKKLIKERRAAFRRYDSATPKEKRILTENGLNPYEPARVRKAKQKRTHDEINKRISELPKETRDKLATLGLYGNQRDERIIHRTTGEIFIK